METFWRDLKHAFRKLRQNPGFTATAITALAHGIGATPPFLRHFSVINTVLLKPIGIPATAATVRGCSCTPRFLDSNSDILCLIPPGG